MMKRIAYFGAGCFWGVEMFLNQQPGVIDTEVGYMGGNEKDFPSPSYEQVCTDMTGYAETVKIIYDPSVISYEKLVEQFFRCHDSTQKDMQGPDIGSQYRSVIFYSNDEELKTSKKVIKREQLKLGVKKKIETTLEKAKTFFKAEEYHQKYWKTHDVYCHVR